MFHSTLTARHSGGHAFSIDDHLSLLRWATLAAPRGYRVVVNLEYKGCDEVIEVFIDPIAFPVFTIHQTGSVVVLVDRLGMTLPFAALTDALLAMVPLGTSARREVLGAPMPPWLPVIPGPAASSLGDVWTRAWCVARRLWPAGQGARRLEPGMPKRR